MTVRLRPHHLLCVPTYVGKGYGPAFTANMTAVAERLCAGEDIELVAEPDDICAPLRGVPDPHCHRASIVERDRAAARDAAGRRFRSSPFVRLRLPVSAGSLVCRGGRRHRPAADQMTMPREPGAERASSDSVDRA